MKKLISAAAIGASLMAGAAVAQDRDLKQEEANRLLVTEFYDRFFNKHDIAAADVVVEGYVQHNPHVPDGRAPFVDYFTGYFAENPDSKARIVRSVAEGDLVWLHIESTNGDKTPAQAIVDIFRVEDNKIVEHWDVIQDVPTESANTNTMF